MQFSGQETKGNSDKRFHIRSLRVSHGCFRISTTAISSTPKTTGSDRNRRPRWHHQGTQGSLIPEFNNWRRRYAGSRTRLDGSNYGKPCMLFLQPAGAHRIQLSKEKTTAVSAQQIPWSALRWISIKGTRIPTQTWTTKTDHTTSEWWKERDTKSTTVPSTTSCDTNTSITPPYPACY